MIAQELFSKTYQENLISVSGKSLIQKSVAKMYFATEIKSVYF